MSGTKAQSKSIGATEGHWGPLRATEAEMWCKHTLQHRVTRRRIEQMLSLQHSELDTPFLKKAISDVVRIEVESLPVGALFT